MAANTRRLRALAAAAATPAPTINPRDTWGGDARLLGSTGGVQLVSPVVGMAPVGAGDGYRLVAGDGGVFSFGAAPFLGRPAPDALHPGRAVGMAQHAGGGYWVAATR